MGPADLTGDQISVNDLGGEYDDWKEGRCEKPTWDMIIRPTTCHFPRGVEPVSNPGTKDVVERDPSPMVVRDSITSQLVQVGKPRSVTERCLPDKLRPQAQERGLTRAIARKRHPDTVEQSPIVRTIILVVAILVHLFFLFDVRAVHPSGGTSCGWMCKVVSNTLYLIGGRNGVDYNDKTSYTTRAQDPLRGLSRGGFPGPSQVLISESKVRDSGGAPMAAGAWTAPPDDNWRPEFTTAAHDSSLIRDTLRARLAAEGIAFRIQPNPNTEEVTASFRAWPIVTSQGAIDEISVSTLLWLPLGIGVHPCR